VKIPTSASLSAFPFFLLFGPLSWLQRLKNSQAQQRKIFCHTILEAPLNLDWEQRRRRKIISVNGKRGSLPTMLFLFQGKRQTLQFKFHVHAHRSLLFCLLLYAAQCWGCLSCFRGNRRAETVCREAVAATADIISHHQPLTCLIF
jgi:hypothetical protein